MSYILNIIYPQFKAFAVNQIEAKGVGLPIISADNGTLRIILNVVFIFIGGWATIFLLIGAFRYVTSGGNQSNITQARETIMYAAIGLAVSALAFTIVQFVLGKVS